MVVFLQFASALYRKEIKKIVCPSMKQLIFMLNTVTQCEGQLKGYKNKTEESLTMRTLFFYISMPQVNKREVNKTKRCEFWPFAS